MKKFLIAASCVSLLAGVTAASAQTNAPQTQQTIKSSDTTDISARKKMMKKKGMMKGDSSKMGGEPMSGSMQGGGMKGGGMGGGMQK